MKHKELACSAQQLQWRSLICVPAAMLFFALSAQAQEEKVSVAPPQFLEAVACPLFGCPDGPPPVQLECRSIALDGQPVLAFAHAAYPFRGMCSNADPDMSVVYRVAATWAPAQTDPSQPNATETYLITGNDNLSPDIPPQPGGYTQRVRFFAHCDSDPWLTSGNCRRLGDTLPGELRQRWPSIATAPFPNTRDAIPLTQRGPLHGEYNAINGIKYAQRPGTARAIEMEAQADSAQENNLDAIRVQDITNQRAQSTAEAAKITSKLDQSDQGVIANMSGDGQRRASGSPPNAPLHRTPTGTYQRAPGFQRQQDQRANHLQLAQPEDTIRVLVRYPVAYGYESASEVFASGPSSCNAFAVNAILQHRSRDDRQPVPIKIAAMPGMRNSNGNYICEYLISYVPLDEPIDVSVRVGTSRNPSTEPWMGGEDVQPAQGQQRVIVNGARTVTLTANQPRASFVFEMMYAGGPSGSDLVR